METSKELKSRGNQYFLQKDFFTAEHYYSLAIENHGATSILLTNRSACKISLQQYEEGIIDADGAISLNPSWTKAYYRKAQALEQLHRFQEAYLCWSEAKSYCEPSEWLEIQFKRSQDQWIRIFRQIPVATEADFISRLSLLSDIRERLSTLAHLWNSSSSLERLSFVHSLLELIGGEGGLSEEAEREVREENMKEMPLINYPDLPKERLQPWFDFFISISSERKTALFRSLWASLSTVEQSAVILDLQLFLSQNNENKDKRTTLEAGIEEVD